MDLVRCAPTKSVQLRESPHVKNINSRPPRSVICCSASSRVFPNTSISYQERSSLSTSGGSVPLHRNTPVLLSKNSARKFRSPVVCAGFKNYVQLKLIAMPRWWLQTIAAVSYLLPLHNVWKYVDVVYHLHHVLEKFEFLANPFLDTMGLMPSLLIITLFMGKYFLVLRRKEWTHFLRFHVVVALFMDTGFQAIATALNWLRRIAYKSQFMVYFWMAFAFSQAYKVFECMRCALTGTYHDVHFGQMQPIYIQIRSCLVFNDVYLMEVSKMAYVLLHVVLFFWLFCCCFYLAPLEVI